MATLREAVEAMLEKDGWVFAPVEGQTTLAMGYKGESGMWSCYAHVDDERGTFVFYSVSDRPVPERHRSATAEFLTRANFGLVLGNFELDFSDGETRFKTSAELGGTEPTLELLRPVVYANIAAMDRYLPGFDGVSRGSMTPQEAIALCEGTQPQ
ncbi:MAG: YbjN domain-containing protein [Thermaerobacter sp.]|nr:YbjN domain-containing protein [Thermaerobacter sp.]